MIRCALFCGTLRLFGSSKSSACLAVDICADGQPDGGAIAHVAVKLRVNGVYTLCAFDNCKACAAGFHTRPVDFPLIA